MNHSVFHARAPVRVDLAGGGTDAPPFCVDHGGMVINAATALYVWAKLEVLPDSSVVQIRSSDFDLEVQADALEALEGPAELRLLVGIARRMAPPWGFRLTVESDVPPRTGLGSSGAVGVACVRAFDAALGTIRSQAETSELGNAVEREDLGNAGGSQDSYGAAIGGLKRIAYQRGGGATVENLIVPDAMRYALEQHAMLVYTGEVHLSDSIHEDIQRSYALPESPTVEALKELAVTARRMSTALAAGDTHEVGAMLSRNWRHHQRLHPSCCSERLSAFYEAVSGRVLGGKTCGAGGGGYILFLAQPGQRKRVAAICRELGGEVRPLRFDRDGVVHWRSEQGGGW